MSVGSFYHQFADKTDLMLAVITNGMETRQSLIVDGMAANHDSLDDMIRAGFIRLFESLDRDRDVWRIQISEQHNPDLRVLSVIREGRQRWVDVIAGAVRPWADDAREKDVVAVAQMLMTIATGAANVYVAMSTEQRESDRTTMMETATGFSIAGVRSLLDIGGA